MTKKIDRNRFYLPSFNKELSEFIKGVVNRRAKDFIDTSQTVVNETAIFMIEKGEKMAEIEVDYSLRNIKKLLLDANVEGVINEINTLVLTKIFSNIFN